MLSFDHLSNLGDVVQTYALCRLLGANTETVHRVKFPETNLADKSWVVSGFFHNDGYPSGFHLRNPDHKNVLFAGVHVKYTTSYLAGNRYPVGARDSYTCNRLLHAGVNAELVGCPTLTLPRYEGPRQGRIAIDTHRFSLSNNWSKRLLWDEKWIQCLRRLQQLRTAELVESIKLHVILPCLAFGTPVIFPWKYYKQVEHPARLILLEDLGFEFDKPQVIDVSTWSTRYINFLSTHLNEELHPVAVRRPRCSSGL